MTGTVKVEAAKYFSMTFPADVKILLIERKLQHLYEQFLEWTCEMNFVWPYEIRGWQCAFNLITK